MIVIKIDIGNAAFDADPGAEVARILKKLASDIESSTAVALVGLEEIDGKPLFDVNGNRTGCVAIT